MTSAELLDLFNRLTGRAAMDKITPAIKYQWLSDAQTAVVSEIATVAPWALFPKVGTANLPTMSTTDNNVFTFGTSGGTPIEPIGSVQIYKYITDVPDRPMVPDLDYIAEGNQIRLPHNRSYAGTLYYRGIVFPSAITAGNNPSLIPTQANELVAIRAARDFAESGNVRNPALADRMEKRWAQRWPRWCLVWKKQFSAGGALRAYSLRDLLTPN
jgi:hypothetical protein